MARAIYGADGSAQVVSMAGVPTTAAATVKTARTGGTTVTDIQNMSGSNLGGIVTPDSRGQIIFQGPDGSTATYWLDFGDGGPRWGVRPVDVSAALTLAMTAREAAQYTAPGGTTAHATLPYVPSSALQKLAEALDSKVIPRVASASARGTAFPSPADGDRVYRTDLHAHQTYRAMGSGSRWVTDPGVIFEGTISSDASVITFSSIPQDWTNLRLLYRARATGSPSSDVKTQRVSLRFNNDAGANYSCFGSIYNMVTASGASTFMGTRAGASNAAGTTTAVYNRENGGVTNLSGSNLTTTHCGVCAGSDLGNLFGGGEITIMDYTSSTSRKPIQGNSGFNDNTGATSGTGYASVSQLQGGWSSNAAINRIDIFAVSATAFASGSYFGLYGW